MNHPSRLRGFLFIFPIVVAAFTSSAFAQKRNITEKDLFSFVWTGDAQFSPDGSRVTFGRVR